MTEAPLDPVDAAGEIQHRAARPDRSVALRASAGSGKTKVLVDRFLRLCIEDGPGCAHPRAILAITFTRKAAVEIEGRLLARARDFALADDAVLSRDLTDLFAGRADPAPTAAEKQAAACLLEKILEDVAGLNVGTIHSFCQLILGRFAAEAGLDPHFAVLENQDELVDEALEQLEGELAADQDLAAAAGAAGRNPTGVRSTLRRMMSEQMRLGRWLAAHGPRGSARTPRLPALLDDLRAFLFPDLAGGCEPRHHDFLPALTAALVSFAGPGADAVAAEIGPEGMSVIKGTTLDKVRSAAREAAAAVEVVTADPDADQPAVEEAVKQARKVFLTDAGTAKVHSRIRKDLALRDLFNGLVAAQGIAVLAQVHRLGYIDLYRRNRDLLRLVLRLLDIYDGLKRRDRVVDFQDLEDMACQLMGDQGSVGSLLYRLDDGLSHIMVDEFQDTNFNQWDMLRPFVDEFLAGDPERPARTVFFVGDVKQSIYGFRGAEPDIFGAACGLLEAHEHRIESLPTNFRSVGDIVGGVGLLFNTPPLADDLPDGERACVRQAWAREEQTGPVRVLAPFRPGQAAGEGVTVDEADPRSGDQLAARTAALLMRRLKEDPEAVTWEGFGPDRSERRLRWDDFLVLTRARTEISLYEQALREEGIPFAPPGRGMLAASREVQDVLALLRWMLWTEDDAALATVLRSPIFRLAEPDFQRVLAARDLFRAGGPDGRYRSPYSLWRALRGLAETPPFDGPVELLTEWRRHLGFDTAHDLLRRICRDADLLARYRQARGDQARYNLQRLFDVALSPEVAGTPTVRRLVDVLEAAAGRGGQDEGALPRAGGEGRVRIMTIHGAKGLEAPVVMLVDADRAAGRESPRVRLRPGAPDTPLLFGVTREHREGFILPPEASWPRDPLQDVADAARRRAATEDANLLYVALTRARDRLYVLGGDNAPASGDHDSPLRRLRAAAAGACGDHVTGEDPPGLDRPPAPAAPAAPTGTGAGGEDGRPWAPPPVRETLRVMTPSGAAPEDEGDPARLAAGPRIRADASEPTERGHRVHLLLQLAAAAGRFPAGTSADHTEAGAVWDDSELDWIFRPEMSGGRGLCEVPVAARLRPGGPKGPEERLVGVIDRLVIRSDRVDIIDYKTNRYGGDTIVRDNLVRHYTPQLNHYRAVMARLFSDRPIRAWLLFTEPGLAADQRLAEVPA